MWLHTDTAHSSCCRTPKIVGCCRIHFGKYFAK
jgi:hypothetical protein